MKIQWNLILALIFALIVAAFAVVNVEPARMDYVFGTTELPLIIIILASALLGGVIIASIGLVRTMMLHRKIKQLTKENAKLEERVSELTREKITSNNEPAEQTDGDLSIKSGIN
ncbi:LapA family protein [Mesobacillus foraminis]|uniref:LapA family protein n=1 Tax=Mesobacillus foraminis TaxID=279826 RepID=UPI000EF514D0|nr:lipopolysaccharide assembly protein LapA domain-containing protein [Mesobacillus foraminis]